MGNLPHTPEKAQEERLEDMTPCIACLQGCVANMYAGKPLCCLVNPVLGRESEGLPKLIKERNRGWKEHFRKAGVP